MSPKRTESTKQKASTQKKGDTNKKADTSVDAYLAALKHPHKNGVLVLRKVILGVDTRIREEVKWNAPSFYLEHHFATFRLHPGSIFQLIFHRGGARGDSKQFRVNDPSGLLKWPAKDRCLIAFQSDEDALEKRAEVSRIAKEWIAQL